MNYALAIKKLREKLILSQTEFAKLMGTSFGTVNRWENDKHEPTIKFKRKLVSLFKENGIALEEDENE